MEPRLYRVNDNYPPVSLHIIDDNQDCYDLTGFTGVWKLREMEATTNKASGTIQITNYTSGYFECRWGANDLDTVGIYYMEFEFSSGSYLMTLPHINDPDVTVKVIAGI